MNTDTAVQVASWKDVYFQGNDPVTGFVEAVMGIDQYAWKTLDEIMDMREHPSWPYAVERLIKKAITEYDEDTHYAIAHMVNVLRTTAQEEITLREKKPAELYHCWMPILRALDKELFFKFQGMMNDLILMQTLPISELDNPGWIDSYTGELVEYERPERLGKIADSVAEQMALDNGESFCQDDGLDEEFFDEHDIHVPAGMEPEATWSPTSDLWSLRQEAKPIIDQCHKKITNIVKMMEVSIAGEFAAFAKVELEIAMSVLWFPRYQSMNPYLSRKTFLAHREDVKALRDTLQEKVSEEFIQTPEAKSFLEFIQDAADKYQPQDVLLVFLSLQNGYAFQEDHMELIHVPGFASLKQFCELFGDEVLEGLTDPMGRGEERIVQDVERFHQETMSQIRDIALEEEERLKALGKLDPVHSAAYTIGYIEHMCNSRKLKGAPEAGMDAWRESISHRGAVAFREAIAKGKTYDEAKAEFWKLAKLARIKGVKKHGVVLTSGREISWYILRLKIENNEMDFAPGEAQTLREMLVKYGVGRDLYPILDKLK